MTVTLRRGTPADAGTLGDICYRAFKAIAEAHNFTPDVPSPGIGAELLKACLLHDRFVVFVAELEGTIVGSNVLDERNPISGVGPITVDPAQQNDGAGRALMQAVMKRSTERGFLGIRLVQAGYHNRSLGLYSKLGFRVREQLACFQGPPLGQGLPGYLVRRASPQDLAVANELCARVHGHPRGGELADAIAQGTARIVVRSGRVTGYATSVAFFGHAVGETSDDVKALIAAAESFAGPGFLVPTRNAELMQWCLGAGLRITQTMTLMSIGLYSEPVGAWLPSVTY